MQVGILGDMTFEVSSFRLLTVNGMSRSGSTRTAKHDVINSKPKLEFLGDDLDSISFNIRLDASLGVNPDREIQYLNEMRKNGIVLDFAIGQRYYGQFLIMSMSEDIKHTYPNGTTMVAEVSLQIDEYVL